MTVDRNYRNEARAARQAGRETLLAYRAARLKSKRGAGPAGAGAAAVADAGGARISPEAFFSMAPQADDPAECTPVEAEASPAGTAAEPSDAPAPEPSETDAADAPDADSAGTGDEAAAPAPPERAVPEASVDPEGSVVARDAPGPVDPPQPADGLATVDPDSDLFALPGAGAGMIWMFHQCGIRSLADLARADARDLSLRLGVVGHILNVEPWIAFARQKGALDE